MTGYLHATDQCLGEYCGGTVRVARHSGTIADDTEKRTRLSDYEAKCWI